MSTQFAPLKDKRTYEKIIDLLKQKVFGGEFRPGDRLPTEREMADTMKVSRLAVREAYRALQMFGMLETRRGQQGGAFICAPRSQSIVQSISDLFRFQGITLEEWNEARLIFEIDIARLAIARAGRADFERLKQIIAAAQQQAESGELAHREHIGFHLCLAQIARNPILLTSYHSMMDLLLNSLIAFGVGSEHYRNVAASHRKILAVMKKGDVDSFLAIIEEHVREAGDNLLLLAKRFPLFKRTTI